jgi:ATP-binding cassette subfamily B protein
VGEGGESLSGGQVQKLELARLLGVEVPCLILDESTSALNPAIEARVVSDLRHELGTSTTVIFVAHRLELAKEADQVLWMEGGHLRAVGGHDDLVVCHPGYRELWHF